MDFEQLMVIPSSPGNVFWHGVAQTPEGWYIGNYSLFDESNDIDFQYFRNDRQLLDTYRDHKAVEQLKWYTNGFYLVRREGDRADAAESADADASSSIAATRSGQVVGTLAYMAPEQARGETEVGAAIDVYAAGAVLFEPLVQAPFRRPDYRLDRPQGIVEIDRQCSNFVHAV